MALLTVDHDNVAVFVFRQHRIASHFKTDGLFRNREGQLNLAQAFRGDLLVFRLYRRAGPNPAHDRHGIEFEVVDDGRDFRRLDQAQPRQDFRHRARTNAHGRRQTALGLARLLQSPLDHPDVQHGTSFPNFRNYSNSDYPKSSLTLISEYQKLLK